MASRLFSLKYGELIKSRLGVTQLKHKAIAEATEQWLQRNDPRHRYILSTLPQGETKKLARAPCLLSSQSSFTSDREAIFAGKALREYFGVK